jgi:hypothetical protein
LIQKTWGKKAVPVAETVEGLQHFSILESLLDASSPLIKLIKKMLKKSQASSKR